MEIVYYYLFLAVEIPSIKDVIDARLQIDNLINSCIKYGWKAENIFILGFGQGGSVALEYVLFQCKFKLGGIISLDGDVSKTSYLNNFKFNFNDATPILITFIKQSNIVLIFFN